MGNTRITNHQLFGLTAFFSFGTSIIYISSSLAGVAKQDAWISAAITPVFGLFFIWLYSYLGALYPGKTFVQIICAVFGKWIGGFIAAAFIFLCIIDVPQVTWLVGNFLKTHTMHETPMLATNALVIIAVVVALFYGIEAIARSSEILLPIVSFLIILALVLVSPKIKLSHIVPIFEQGIVPVFKGSIILVSYSTWPLIIINILYPSHLDNIKDARRAYFFGFLWGSVINFLCTTIAILVLGSSIAAIAVFPTFLLAQEISLGGLITRMEAVISTAWLISLFFKALLYFYGGLIGLSQLLLLRDHKRIILPLGLLSLVLSFVVYPNSAYEAHWDTETWIPYIATFAAVLPILLLIGTVIKRHAGNKGHMTAPDQTNQI